MTMEMENSSSLGTVWVLNKASLVLAIASASIASAITALLLISRQKSQKKHHNADQSDEEPKLSKSEILEKRRKNMCSNQSISFSSSPLVIVRGEGSYLYDEDGTEYLDCVNNVAHVGHCHPKVTAAVCRQLGRVNTNTRYLHPARAAYVERLLATFPPELDVAFLVCSGTEANDLALRLASTWSGNPGGGAGAGDVLVLDGAYHGHSGALVDLSPYKHAWQGGGRAPAHVHTVRVPDLYRAPMGTTARDFAGDVPAAVARLRRATGRRPVALFAEAVLGCCGQVPLPAGYLRAAYAAVRAAGGLCVADEVQTGFGRCGAHFWAFEAQGVVPDVVTFGKPAGNGVALAGVVCRRAVAERFRATGVEYFSTFGGSTAACAAGLAVLDAIRDDRLQENARATGKYLMRRLQYLCAKYECVGHVRGMGLFVGVEIVKDKRSKEPDGELAAKLSTKMKEDYQVLISLDGKHNSAIKIKPPMTFDKSCVDRLCFCLDMCLHQLLLTSSKKS